MEIEYDIVEARYEGTNYVSTITANGNQLISDEPESVGGQNKGFNPFEWVIAGLASCTIATIKMYLDRKGWKADNISVQIRLETGKLLAPVITKQIRVEGTFQPEQLKRILAVANNCPTHKLLSKGITISAELKDSKRM